MNTRNIKLALLHQLSLETEAISLQTLLKKMGDSISERSMRRWLVEMIREGLIQKIGDKRGAHYQIITGEKRSLNKDSSVFGPTAKHALEQIRRPLYERNPITYRDDWIEGYQPNSTFYIPTESRNILQKAGERSKREDPAGTYAHQIFNRLLIDLSYNSSRLEGNTYSLLDTKRLILEGTGVEGKLDEEKIMILNHKEAIRYIVDNARKLEITGESICTLHFLLADGLVESRYAGKLRDYGVRIGGSVYIPFEDKNQLQIRFNRIITKAAKIENPYEQSLFLLIHLSYLQGFCDVNKRTARLSANIPLIKTNLVPLSFNDVERDDYTSAILAIYELQNIYPILDLYLFSYMRTCAMYDSTVQTMGFDEIRVRYRPLRRAIISYIILHKLIGKPKDDYIYMQSLQVADEEERESFLEDIREDLQEINSSRIAGLGVTPEQFKIWKDAHSNLY